MNEILIATGNAKKGREMIEILVSETPALPVRWRTLAEFPDWPQPVEDAETFGGNAAIKAGYYARHSGLWTIADDSGLEVDALGGDPGVRSARYAGEPCDDAANNHLLIERLRGIPAERRTARFRCAVALSDGKRVLARAEGAVEGRIIDQPLGENGFGYDPYFWVDAFDMTTARMSPQQKHAISHRGQALRTLRQKIAELLKTK
jgi:XTP/dITP diphosphohydrolase